MITGRWYRCVATTAWLVGSIPFGSVPLGAQGVMTADATRGDDPAAARALLARPITVRLDRVSLAHAIEIVSDSAHIRMVYQHELAEASSKIVTVHATRIPLRAVLEQVLEGTGLEVVPLHSGQLALADRSNGRLHAAGGIAGTVIAANTKRPVAGATLALDDTAAVVHTDQAGRYRFQNVATGSHRITVRAVGYARQSRVLTVTDDQTATVEFALASSVNTLDQVVVTATGEQRVRELGHAVARVNADSLVREAPITSMSDLLQSRIPGLQVITGNGGLAGGEISLRLRGTSTFNLDPEPIVIVDGVRYKSNNLLTTWQGVNEDSRGNGGDLNSPLNELNPNDIETIEVVKGPSASTLYGPDASNGVIVITTKRGTPGQTKFQWYARPVTNSVPRTRIQRGYQAWGHDSTGHLFQGNCSVLQQYAWGECILDSITVAPTTISDSKYSILAKSRPTWQYGASVNGGSQALRYFLSGNYDSQTGALQMSPAAVEGLQKQLGVDKIKDAVRNPNTLQMASVRANLSADVTSKATLNLTANYAQTQHTTTNANMFFAQYGRGALSPGYDTTNLVGYDDMTYSLYTTDEQVNHLTTSASGTAQLLSWLTATGSAGLDLSTTTSHSLLPAGETSPTDGGRAQDDRRTGQGRTLTGGMTALLRPGIWSFRSSLGAQYTYAHIDGLSGYANNLAPGSSSISTGRNQGLGTVWSELASLGTYGEEVVGWKDRLFVTGSLRLDGSTTFGDAYRAHPYPKVGVSWIASDEPWLRNTPGLHELHFRWSYGAASRYPTSAMKLGVIYGYSTPVEGQSQNIFYWNQLANLSLRPEQAREMEYGLDATVLNDIVVSLIWNRRRTEDLLQVVYPFGVPGAWANTGDIQAHGLEATVNVPVLETHGIRADLGFAYSFHTDKVVSLGNLPEFKTAWGGGRALGYPVGALFGNRITGVADTVGGHADGIIFYNEVVRDTAMSFLGVQDPPKTYTVTPTVTLMNGRVRFSALFDRQTGFMQLDRFSMLCPYNALCLGPFLTSTPPLIQAKYASGTRADDFLEPGDFTRWREFNVSMDIPQRLLHWDMIHLRFTRATVSLQGRNLALWTKYQGTDPESHELGFSGFGSGSAGGIPQARAWSFRFDVTP